MRPLLLSLALICAVISPAAAQGRDGRFETGWVEFGRSSYPRADYSQFGPAPLYYPRNAYAITVLPGPQVYEYQNGTRVWYGTVLAPAPVLAPSLQLGAARLAPPSPGPRLYVTPNGTRVWYGSAPFEN